METVAIAKTMVLMEITLIIKIATTAKNVIIAAIRIIAIMTGRKQDGTEL